MAFKPEATMNWSVSEGEIFLRVGWKRKTASRARTRGGWDCLERNPQLGQPIMALPVLKALVRLLELLAWLEVRGALQLLQPYHS